MKDLAALRHRYAALAKLRNLSIRDGTEHQRVAIQLFATTLAAAEFRSYLLPIDGAFISPGTPATFRWADCQLPFPKLMLEYSTSPDPPDERQRTFAKIIIIERNDRAVSLRFLWRGPLGEQKDTWFPATSRFLLYEDARLEFDGSGGRRDINLKRIPFPGAEPVCSAQAQARMMLDYADDLRAVAHFALFCRWKSIVFDLVPPQHQTDFPPNECYVPRCLGPKGFSLRVGDTLVARP